MGDGNSNRGMSTKFWKMKIRWLNGKRLSGLEKAQSNPAGGRAKNKARCFKQKNAMKSREPEAPLKARVGVHEKGKLAEVLFN